MIVVMEDALSPICNEFSYNKHPVFFAQCENLSLPTNMMEDAVPKHLYLFLFGGRLSLQSLLLQTFIFTLSL